MNGSEPVYIDLFRNNVAVIMSPRLPVKAESGLLQWHPLAWH